MMKRNGHNHFTRTKYIHSAYLCPKGNQKRDLVLVLPAIYGQCSPIKRWKKLSRPPSCLHRASEAATLRRNRQKCAKPLAETRNDHAIIVKTKSLFIKRDGLDRLSLYSKDNAGHEHKTVDERRRHKEFQLTAGRKNEIQKESR